VPPSLTENMKAGTNALAYYSAESVPKKNVFRRVDTWQVEGVSTNESESMSSTLSTVRGQTTPSLTHEAAADAEAVVDSNDGNDISGGSLRQIQ
jgi:hypothetical protein